MQTPQPEPSPGKVPDAGLTGSAPDPLRERGQSTLAKACELTHNEALRQAVAERSF